MGLPIFSLVIILASLLSSIFPELASIFIFDRSAIFRGEIWRIFTCHFVHFSNTHLAYNIFAFGIVGYIIEKKKYPNFCLLYFCLAFSISISLFVLKPNMLFFGGLSGIVCGALYYCALMGIKESQTLKRISFLIVTFLPIKIAAEIYTNASILPYWEHQSFIPMQTSHIIGCLVAALFYLSKNIRKNALTNNFMHMTGDHELVNPTSFRGR